MGISAWDIVVPYAVLAAICALTPGLLAIIMVAPLRDREQGIIALFFQCCVVSFAFALLLVSIIPYRDLPSSVGTVVGISMAVCLGASAIIALFVLITVAETEDRSLYDWDE